MALSLIEWLKSEEFLQVKEKSPKEFVETTFFRNPLRNISINDYMIKAPADGVLLYQGRYKANEKILEIKGKKYTIRDILMNGNIPKDKSFYVAGIYLTTFSVHLIRAVTKGVILNIEDLPPLLSNNYSMTPFEYGLIKGSINLRFMQFSFYNQRTVIKTYSNTLKTNIYYVLIADADVDRNLLFKKENEPFLQGERLAYVVFGSQCDILIEAKPWFRLRKLIPNFYYIYAGLDDLFQISLREAPV